MFASALAAPGNYIAAPAGLPLAHAGAPALLHAAPVAPYVAQPAAISLPAPHVTQAKAADVTTLHKPQPIVTKQVHLGQTSYISGHTTQILKPAIPDFKIAVPTALKGTQSVSAPIVTVQKEVHTVNEPVHVEKPYNVPYDVIKPVEKIVEVPTPYHVAKPYPVPHPVPVQGEPIIHKVQGAPIVRKHHTNVVAQPALAYAAHAQPALAYAAHAQPALAYAHQAPVAVAHHA